MEALAGAAILLLAALAAWLLIRQRQDQARRLDIAERRLDEQAKASVENKLANISADAVVREWIEETSEEIDRLHARIDALEQETGVSVDYDALVERRLRDRLKIFYDKLHYYQEQAAKYATPPYEIIHEIRTLGGQIEALERRLYSDQGERTLILERMGDVEGD